MAAKKLLHWDALLAESRSFEQGILCYKNSACSFYIRITSIQIDPYAIVFTGTAVRPAHVFVKKLRKWFICAIRRGKDGSFEVHTNDDVFTFFFFHPEETLEIVLAE